MVWKKASRGGGRRRREGPRGWRVPEQSDIDARLNLIIHSVFAFFFAFQLEFSLTRCDDAWWGWGRMVLDSQQPAAER